MLTGSCLRLWPKEYGKIGTSSSMKVGANWLKPQLGKQPTTWRDFDKVMSQLPPIPDRWVRSEHHGTPLDAGGTRLTPIELYSKMQGTAVWEWSSEMSKDN